MAVVPTTKKQSLERLDMNKPIPIEYMDFSEEILADLVKEGYEGLDLIHEFKKRKRELADTFNAEANDILIHGKKTTVDELFGED